MKRLTWMLVAALFACALSSRTWATAPGTLDSAAWDVIVQQLQQSQSLSQARAEMLFNTGGGVVVGHYSYGLARDGTTPHSDRLKYVNHDERMGHVIDDLQLEVMGGKRTVLRLDVHFRPDICINARAVIVRYGLEESPPVEPNPGAQAVEFARSYPGGNLWLYVPVPPARHPSTMVDASSCVGEMGIFSNAPSER